MRFSAFSWMLSPSNVQRNNKSCDKVLHITMESDEAALHRKSEILMHCNTCTTIKLDVSLNSKSVEYTIPGTTI